MFQAFRPLHTSIFNPRLQPQRPRYPYHPQYAFFMIPDLAYNSKDLNVSNQVKSKPTCSLLGLSATGLHTKGLCHLVNTLTSIESIMIGLVALTKLTSAQGKSPSCVQLVFHPHHHQKCSRVVHPTTQRVDDLQKG